LGVRHERPCDRPATNHLDKIAPSHCRANANKWSSYPLSTLAHKRTRLCPLTRSKGLGLPRCPLWVKSRHMRCNKSCPLYIQ